MIDALIGGHLLLQLARLAAALFLFGVLYALGATLLRSLDATPLERVLLRIAAGFAAFQWIVRVAGALALLRPLGVIAIVLALAAIPLIRRRRLLPSSEGRRGIECDWRTVAIALLLLAPLTIALAPSVSRDALIYQLRFPELTLRDGSWGHDPANSASFYPAAIGTLYVAALAVDAHGVIAQLVHFGFFVLTILAAAAIARRLSGRSGRDAALLFAALPAAGVVAGWAWADHSLLFALACSVIAIFAGAPILALALLGLAASIKYTALLVGLPIGIAIVVQLVRAREFRKLGLGIALAIVVASPWYASNFLRTGNPIHPLGDPTQRRTSMQVDWARDAEQSRAQVWSGYFVRPQTLDEDVGGLLFIAIAALGITLAVRDRRLRVPLIVIAAMWLMFAPFTPASRLLLPAVTATLIVAGAAFASMQHRWIAIVLVAAFAIRGGAIVAAHNAHFMNPAPAAAGIESEDDYIARNFPNARLYARAATSLPPDARVIAMNEVRLFGFPRPVSASRNLDVPLILRYVGGAHSLDEVLARLRIDGVTHLLIAARPVERGKPAPLTKQQQQLVTELLRKSRLIDREGGTMLFALPR